MQKAAATYELELKKEAGSYVLWVKVPKGTAIEVGALGTVHFEKGSYAYTGSAMGGLGARISRHLRKEKKLHWHIDRLTAARSTLVTHVYYTVNDKSLECQTAKRLSRISDVVPGFGSSDCKCQGHLFRITDMEKADRSLKRMGYQRLKC